MGREPYLLANYVQGVKKFKRVCYVFAASWLSYSACFFANSAFKLFKRWCKDVVLFCRESGVMVFAVAAFICTRLTARLTEALAARLTKAQSESSLNH